MNKSLFLRRLFRMAPATVVIIACVSLGGNPSRAQTIQYAAHKPVLGACEPNTFLFPDTPDTWRGLYDTRVNAVIQQHQARAQNNCSQLAQEPPTFALRFVAGFLPPWKDPKELAKLTEADMSSVLIEHLRVYECAMRSAQFQKTGDIGSYVEDVPKMQHDMDVELAVAPKALERTLKVLAGLDRLRSLDRSLDCLARTSLDIRNTLGLAAETSACLPRVWDSRSTLRSTVPNP